MPTRSQPVTTLWVASAGGHLTQARLLSHRIASEREVWVTYPVGQAAALLADREVIHAHHPTTRHPGNAARNYLLARRVLEDLAIDRVVSTGAAVAVPFMLRARQLGVPCHYIESATRVRGPSLSGRLLEWVPGVRLYRQSGDWTRRPWRPGPSVLEGFRATALEQPGQRPLRRVVVSLGTHRFGFATLVHRLAAQVAGRSLDITWQLGSTPAPGPLPGRVVGELPPGELEEAIRVADVVVGHGGVGLALTALSLGKVPVLVPRRRQRREHTDDHQVEMAGELDRRGLAVVADAEEVTLEHLERAAGLAATWEQPPAFTLDA